MMGSAEARPVMSELAKLGNQWTDYRLLGRAVLELLSFTITSVGDLLFGHAD